MEASRAVCDGVAECGFFDVGVQEERDVRTCGRGFGRGRGYVRGGTVGGGEVGGRPKEDWPLDLSEIS